MAEETQEVPKWLMELEEKRERRLKARLGHEAGAGSPCLTCGEKCPGLDLHFWRKICKNCKCGKETHDVNDDDIYGWAQFQLLGSKPNKSKKIVLPGRKDAVELEWMPRGQNDVVESYLNDLPVNFLPIKGSVAAQQRKQLLQKQIPLHDIDPTLCHALSETEVKKMNDYIAHIKQNSVGVGHIMKLNELLKNQRSAANAQILASRSPMQVPQVQNIILQGVDRANALKGSHSVDLQKGLQDLSLNKQKMINMEEGEQTASNIGSIRDLFYDSYNRSDQHARTAPLLKNENAGSFGTVEDVKFETPTVGAHFKNLPHFAASSVTNLEDKQQPLEHAQIRNVYPDMNVNYEPAALQVHSDSERLDNVHSFKGDFGMPHYAPGKFNTFVEQQNPQKIGNIKDLAYSTYDQSQSMDISNKNVSLPNYDPSEMSITEQNLKSTNYNPGNINAVEQNIHPRYSNDASSPRYPVNFNSGSPKYSPSYKSSEINMIEQNVNPKYPPSYKPSEINVLEQNLNPTMVNIGSINDIEYPTIKSAVHTDNNTIYEPEVPRRSVQFNLDPQEILPCCHKCRKRFDASAIVIGIDRTDALWHAACFRCAGCNQNLADLMYFYHKDGDDIYCGRDYAKIRGIPRCQACDELIFVKEYCLAENSTFHVKHFCCFECDEPLAGRNYVMEEAQPLCLPCFEKLKAEKCQACLHIIKPDEQGAVLNGVHFHADNNCFVCKVCRKPLLGTKLLFKNQNLYCSACCFGTDK